MKIVIGSVLKTLTDVRHYNKIALSLLKIPGVRIYILARSDKQISVHENLVFKPLVPSSFKLVHRLTAPWIFLYWLFRIRPEAVIVCTHELLIPAVIYKCIKSCILIYDVQENYALNILCNLTYPLLFRKFLSASVRTKERIAAIFIHRFWLAEICYKTELPFLSDGVTVLENKSLASGEIYPVSLKDESALTLLFSGTIAIENGILEAIELTKRLYELNTKYSIQITGCCHNLQLFKKLHKISRSNQFVKLSISTEPIRYELITKHIGAADIGIISYRKQNNFQDKMPTKLYEYISAGLPVLVQKNDKWENLCSAFDAAIPVEFSGLNYDSKSLDYLISNKIFYENISSDTEQLKWSSVENNLIRSFKDLLTETS